MMITIMAGDQHNDFAIFTSMMITILVISIVTIIIVSKAEGREVPQCSFVGNDWWPEPGRWPAIHLSCFHLSHLLALAKYICILTTLILCSSAFPKSDRLETLG